jgi:phenylalanyl-tRNA synthetase beta chain
MIEPVDIHYSTDTPLGKRVKTPLDLGKSKAIRIDTIEQALGQELGAKTVGRALETYGYHVASGKGSVKVKLPLYRQDLMHTMDVVEDVAMSLGYAEFTPVMPAQFTVGGLSDIEQTSDRARELMVGLGFQEIISNILGSPESYSGRMRLDETAWGRMVEVDNVMSLSFSCLRQWILPSLLRVETASSRAFYPHRLFEAGDVAIPVATQELEYSLETVQHPSFLEGRAGQIVVAGRPVGVIGELHPEVLERWQIAMPVVAFDLNLSHLADRAEVREILN